MNVTVLTKPDCAQCDFTKSYLANHGIEYDVDLHGTGEVDPARRRQLVVDAQRVMDKSAAFVWLTNEANTLVYRNWIRPAGVPGWIDWQYDDFGRLLSPTDNGGAVSPTGYNNAKRFLAPPDQSIFLPCNNAWFANRLPTRSSSTTHFWCLQTTDTFGRNPAELPGRHVVRQRNDTRRQISVPR